MVLEKGGKVFVKRLGELNIEEWNKHVELFRCKYKGWESREMLDRSEAKASIFPSSLNQSRRVYNKFNTSRDRGYINLHAAFPSVVCKQSFLSAKIQFAHKGWRLTIN